MLFENKLKKILNLDKIEQEFEENMEDVELEKNDRKAMIIAAIIVFVPAMLFIIAAFCFVIWFFFGRFA